MDTTHLDERDHVAQGFVHLLQSVLPLLGRRAVVVAFHVNALIVHSSHFGAAVAGGGRRGRSERLSHMETSWLPALLSSPSRRATKPPRNIFRFQPGLPSRSRAAGLLTHAQSRLGSPETPIRDDR